MNKASGAMNPNLPAHTPTVELMAMACAILEEKGKTTAKEGVERIGKALYGEEDFKRAVKAADTSEDTGIDSLAAAWAGLLRDNKYSEADEVERIGKGAYGVDEFKEGMMNYVGGGGPGDGTGLV